MSLGRYRPWGQSPEKIRPEHRDRAAVVYVRQSSRQQVLEHSESTRLQYALAERAAALGWARSRIVVIDDDLGVSAATADARAGFARLVTEVTMGRVGIVLGIEMSRLAASQASASMDKVMWAYQARQVRTWYWSSPASPLACSEHSSIGHL